jgi:hypothetical protein
MNRCPGLARLLGGFTAWLSFLTVPSLQGQATDVLTYHNDNARTGQALNEQILNFSNVNTNHFGKLWTLPADGKVDAEPLYTAGVPIPGQGFRNVLYVATEHGSVYAFDADHSNTFWRVSLWGAGETNSDSRGCDQVTPEIGVTSTPVIDRSAGSNGTLFAVAMTRNLKSGEYFQRLHALDLATGVDRLPPVTVSATYPGNGAASSGGFMSFDPKQYKERAALLLLNGVIYTAWASHCDIEDYSGWIIGYDEATLEQTNVLDITPNGSEGAIWMAGDGLAADSSGNLYFLAANGSFETRLSPSGFPTNNDFGNCFMKLSTTNGSLAVSDYFTMSTNTYENGTDEDLGSGGELLLPDMADSQGHTRQLAVGAGKDHNIYLVDRNNMGKFSSANNNAIYQEVGRSLSGQVFSMPAYFNGTLYYGAVGDHLKAYPFVSARLGAVKSQSAVTFAYPGATPSVSASGSSNGIVWVTANNSPAVLHAYAATNLTVELYNSGQAPAGRDNYGVGNKFITPMIASARVYVGTTGDVGVFGLLDQSTLTPIEVWRDNQFGNPSDVGAGADTASPAGDGVPNLIKYALGLNPLTPAAQSQLPSGGIEQDGGENYLTLTVNRAASAPDVTYTVEVSGDLLNWDTGPLSTTILADTPTQLVVRDNTPVPGSTARFIRLAVSSP